MRQDLLWTWSLSSELGYLGGEPQASVCNYLLSAVIISMHHHA